MEAKSVDNLTSDKCNCESDVLTATQESKTSSDSDGRKSVLKTCFANLGILRRAGKTFNFIGGKRNSKKGNNASLKKLTGPTAMKSDNLPSTVACKTDSKDEESQEIPTSSSSCCQCTCFKQIVEVEPPQQQNFLPTADQEDDGCHNDESIPESVEAVVEMVPVADARSAVEESPPQPHPEAFVSDQVLANVYGNGTSANSGNNVLLAIPSVRKQWIQLGWIHEDCDEAARIQRAREIEQGVEAPANFRPVRRVQLLYTSDVEGGNCCGSTENGSAQQASTRRLQLVCSPDLTVDSLRALFQNQQRLTLRSCPLDSIAGCHTQVDFIHCLVPDLLAITNCSFYWGKMDRYEAERLLDGKPEGTFLLRDSAQEEFLFSVSFRKYNRSLHARIEQWNHKFSFDSHDPGVYTSDTVCGLIEHYKDPSSCMFFEPMLTYPLHRNFSFSLQHLCRSVIVNSLQYDDINQLQLPKCLKSYLKEYHYRQKVRVERFEDDIQWLDCRNILQ